MPSMEEAAQALEENGGDVEHGLLQLGAKKKLEIDARVKTPDREEDESIDKPPGAPRYCEADLRASTASATRRHSGKPCRREGLKQAPASESDVAHTSRPSTLSPKSAEREGDGVSKRNKKKSRHEHHRSSRENLRVDERPFVGSKKIASSATRNPGKTIEDHRADKKAVSRSIGNKAPEENKPKTRIKPRCADLVVRTTEEDEYLEASSGRDENEAAPRLVGSVIRTEETKPSADEIVATGENTGETTEESIINSQTFIKLDTNIQSNDPAAKKPHSGDDLDGNNVDDDYQEEMPDTKYGWFNGCLRDTHMKHGILYLGNVIYLFAWWIRSIQWKVNDCDRYGYSSLYGQNKCNSFFGDSPGLATFVWLLMFGLFLVEFFYSSTGKYLRNINTTEGKKSKVND